MCASSKILHQNGTGRRRRGCLLKPTILDQSGRKKYVTTITTWTIIYQNVPRHNITKYSGQAVLHTVQWVTLDKTNSYLTNATLQCPGCFWNTSPPLPKTVQNLTYRLFQPVLFTLPYDELPSARKPTRRSCARVHPSRVPSWSATFCLLCFVFSALCFAFKFCVT